VETAPIRPRSGAQRKRMKQGTREAAVYRSARPTSVRALLLPVVEDGQVPEER
jgi:hypothetical protein